LEKIRVCTSYEGAEGATFDSFPYHQTVLHHTSAKLTDLRGWSEELGECRSLSDLPAAARESLQFIAEHVGTPVALVGVGPGPEQGVGTAARLEALVARRRAAAA